MPRSRRRLAGLVLATALACATAPLVAMPDAAQGAMQAAGQALLKGDGIKGEAELNKALAAGASRTEVAARMGEALIQQGEYQRAREWLGPGQFAPGEEAHGWRMRGLLEQTDGNLAAAGQAFDHALKLTPKDPMLWVDIGRLRYRGGGQIQAIEAADRALAAGPDNPNALEFRAQLLRDQAGWEAALPLYEKALEASPNDITLLGGYAATLGELGRATEMLAQTRKMIGIAPRHPYAWYLQAILAARAGKLELARRLLARTGTKLKDVPAAAMLQGMLELEAGNANLAADLLERLATRQPANGRVQLLYARALYETDDFSKLHARFDPLAARADAPSYLLELVGRAYEEEGDRVAAAPFLDRAAGANGPALMPIPEANSASVLAGHWADAPGVAATAVPYVRSLLAANNVPAAQAVAQKFRQTYPGSADAMVLWGDVALVAKEPGAALDAYRLSAQVHFPDLLLLRLAEALGQSGRGGDTVPLVASYLRGYPGSVLAARMAASHRAYAGDWQQARLLLENLRRRGGGRDARLLADLALAQLRSGDPGTAVETAEAAYALQPASSVTAQSLGMALAAAGQDPDRARTLLDKAKTIGGDNPLLAEARKQLGKG